jgi:hypothetical protein
MLLVILAVIQIVLLAVLVILFLTKGRNDLQNSVPELLTGLADLRSSAERLEGKVSADMRNLRADSPMRSRLGRKPLLLLDRCGKNCSAKLVSSADKSLTTSPSRAVIRCPRPTSFATG